MSEDRKEICRIVSKMLDNPDTCGIYPTTECYDELEKYIIDVRFKTAQVTAKTMKDAWETIIKENTK